MGWYEDVFSKNGASNAQDFSNFNYSTEQEKIKRKRELASNLLQQAGKGQQGQFIKNGDFIGYAGGNTVLSAALQGLTAYLGMKSMDGADSDQKTLDKNSLEALQYNMDNKPWEMRLAEMKQSAAPALEESGMSPPVAPDTESLPVREQPQSTARPLDTIAGGSPSRLSLGSMVAGSGAVPVAGGPSTYVGNGEFKSLNAPTSSLTPDMVKAASARLGQLVSAEDLSVLSAIGGSPPATPAPITAQPPAPARTPPTGPMPSITAAPAVPTPTAQPSPLQTAQAQPAPAQAQQGPTMAEQMAYLQRIANSGPAGQQAANALMQQMTAKPQFAPVKVNNADGSESVIAWDPTMRNVPQVAYKPQSDGMPSGRQLERDKFASESFKNLSTAQEELNTSQQLYSKVQNARDLLTKYAPTGGVFSSIYSGIAKALGNDQANALDMALKDLAFSDLKSSFGGNPTEGERKAQLDVKASIERGLAPSQASLDILSAGIERRMRTGAQQVEYWRGNVEQYRSQQPQRPPGGQGAGLPSPQALFPRR